MSQLRRQSVHCSNAALPTGQALRYARALPKTIHVPFCVLLKSTWKSKAGQANRQLVAKAQRTTRHLLFVLSVSPAGQQTCSHLMSPARAEENVCINYQTSSTLARATNDMSNCDHYQASPAWAPIYCHRQRQKKTFALITTSSLARARNDMSSCNHHEALPACTSTDCCPGP